MASKTSSQFVINDSDDDEQKAKGTSWKTGLPERELVDLSVFELKDEDDEMSNENDVDKHECDYKSCVAVQRIATALRYYSVLNIVRNASDLLVFENFAAELYAMYYFINDYVHLLHAHEHETHEIQQYLVKKVKLFKPCDLKSCAFTKRHESVQQEEEEKKEDENVLDEVMTFYKDTFDALHFYLFHLFDVGLRTSKTTQSESEQQQQQQQQQNNTDAYYDPVLARINKLISERKHLTKAFGRFQTNAKGNKFCINTQKEEKKEGQTFMDSVFERLRAMKISSELMHKLRSVIEEEEYDTDSLEVDLLHLEQHGHLAQCLGNDTLTLHAIRDMFRAAKAMDGSFSVGLRFYYWPWFKDRENTNEDKYNKLDHSGYSVGSLFVRRKYGSFKQELFEYGFGFNVMKYNEKVLLKAKALKLSKKVKAMKAWYDDIEPSLAHYGIAEGAVLGFHHIVAVILYTDFSELSGDFSSTFRKSHAFETLESVKRRNSVYWWWAKTLRETVELYGQTWYHTTQTDWKTYQRKETKNTFRGPFYCGMDVVLKMPQFLIRLSGPTSTSMFQEVARQFSKENGIIIQLNNTRFVRGLNCSWIGRYPEEAERVFIGGYFPLEIQSILLMKSNHNLQSVVKALSALDTLLSGGRVRERDEEMGVVLSNLLVCYFGGESKMKFDQYIIDTFTHYALQKHVIHLNLENLYYSNKEVVNLVMNAMEQQDLFDKKASMDLRVWLANKSESEETEQEESERVNLFKSSLSRIFTNVHTLTIHIASCNGLNYYIYPFSFVSLLSLIQESKIRKVIIKADRNYYSRDVKCIPWDESWLDVWFSAGEYADDRKRVETQYQAQNYRLEKPKHVQVGKWFKETQCVISRMQ